MNKKTKKKNITSLLAKISDLRSSNALLQKECSRKAKEFETIDRETEIESLEAIFT